MASFAADPVMSIAGLPLTNTFIHTLIVDATLIGITYFVAKNLKEIPGFFQNSVEWILETFYNLTESMAEKRAMILFPYVMSFFLFILVANLTALFPGVGTIGFLPKDTTHSTELAQKVHASEPIHQETTTETIQHNENTPAYPTESQSTASEHSEEIIPIIRGATSDINVTLALAIISVVATHMLSIRLTGIKDYLSRYFSLNPINLFVGILEIAAEITKIVSLSFRLFGNIFAGEVALHTVSKLFAFLFPLPFLLLETIVGVVQALVFSILTLVFMALLTTPHHAHEEVRTSEAQ